MSFNSLNKRPIFARMHSMIHLFFASPRGARRVLAFVAVLGLLFAGLGHAQDWSVHFPDGLPEGLPEGFPNIPGMPGGAPGMPPGATTAPPRPGAVSPAMPNATWEAAWVGGRVRSGATVLTGARVWASRDETLHGEAEAENALNGNFALGLTAGKWTVYAEKERYRTSEIKVTVAPGQERLDLDFNLQPSVARLRIHVAFEDGRPLVRTHAMALPAPTGDDEGSFRMYGRARTDTAGWARTDVDAGHYTALVMHPRHWVKRTSTAAVRAGEEGTIRVVVAPKNSRLAGIVVEEGTDRPIPGALVVANPEMDFMARMMRGEEIDPAEMMTTMTRSGSTRADTAGHFSARTGPGKFSLMAMKTGWQMTNAVTAEVADGGRTTRLVIRMRRAPQDPGTRPEGESLFPVVLDGRHVLLPNVVLHFTGTNENEDDDEENAVRVLRGPGLPDTSLQRLAPLPVDVGEPLDGHWTVTDHTARAGATYTYVIETGSGRNRRRSNPIVVTVPEAR